MIGSSNQDNSIDYTGSPINMNYRYDVVAGGNNINLFSTDSSKSYWDKFSVAGVNSGKKNNDKFIFKTGTNILPEKIRLHLEMTLPENVEWLGNKDVYDSATRKVTMDLDEFRAYAEDKKYNWQAIVKENVKVTKVTTDGSDYGQEIATIPVSVTGTYDGYTLEAYNSSINITNSKLDIEGRLPGSENLRIGAEGVVLSQGVEYKEFKMNYKKPVSIKYTIDDKYADLKKAVFANGFIDYLDRSLGTNWTVEIKERTGSEKGKGERTRTISRNEVISQGLIASADYRIYEYVIKGSALKINSGYNGNAFQYTFDVLTKNRYTNDEIPINSYVECENRFIFDNKIQGNSKTYRYKIIEVEDKIILSITDGDMKGYNYSYVEGMAAGIAFQIQADDSGILKKDFETREQLTFRFKETDKVRVKDFSFMHDYNDMNREGTLEIKYETNKGRKGSLSKSVKYKNELSGLVNIPLEADECLTSLTIDSPGYVEEYGSFSHLDYIMFKLEFPDTDFVTTADKNEKNVEWLEFVENETEDVYVRQGSHTTSLVAQNMNYDTAASEGKHYGVSTVETINRGDQFTINNTINMRSGYVYDQKGTIMNPEIEYTYGYQQRDIFSEGYSGVWPEYTGMISDEVLDFGIINPTIYIPIPKGFNYVENSITINDEKYKTKKPSSKVVSDENGQRYIEVAFYGSKDENTSLYIASKDMKKEAVNESYFQIDMLYDLDLSYDLEATYLTKLGTNNLTEENVYVDYVSGYDQYLKQTKEDTVLNYGGYSGSTTITVNGKQIRVTAHTPNKQTIINVAGESAVYVDVLSMKDGNYEKDMTVKGGDQFKLISTIGNGTKSDKVSEVFMYIPLKNGVGEANYQWNMKLTGYAKTNSGINAKISYSTKTNPSMNYSSTEPDYQAKVENIEDVTCIKVRIFELNPGEQFDIELPVVNQEKTELGDKQNHVKTYYKYLKGSTPVQNNTEGTYVTLTDHVLQGKVWNDADMNGILDASEQGIEDVSVSLYHNNNGEFENQSEVQTNAKGQYEIKKPEIHDGDYLEISLPKGKNLVPEAIGNYPSDKTSQFNRETKRVILKEKQSEVLNAGLYTLQPLTTDKGIYDVYIGKGTVNIGAKYSPETPKQVIEYKIADEYKKYLNIDQNGNMTGLIEAYDIPVEVYYINNFKDKISKTIKVNVKRDNPPVLTVPEVLEFNVGDKFDPKNPDIIRGLAVSDAEDELTLDDVKVEEEVPREGKFLWFFTTKETNSLTTAGTYKVTYTVTDSGNNEVSKELKVKVNGLPYFTNSDKVEYEKEVTPFYLRARQTGVEYYENLKAYYLKASDSIGKKPAVTEIPNSLNGGSQEKGELSAYHFANVKNPDTMVDNINDAGKYTLKYRATTPTKASATIDRTVYVRGNVEQTKAHSIAISATNEQTFKTWDEFLDVYGKEVGMSAKVKVPQENGDVVEEDIKAENFEIITRIGDIPFGKFEDGQHFEVQFKAIDEEANYKHSEELSSFTIDIENKVGLTPHIQLPNSYDNERVEGDVVYVNGEKREDNFLQALLDEAKIYDVDDDGKIYEKTPEEHGTSNNPSEKKYGIKEKGIESIYRVDNGKNEKIYEKGDGQTTEQLDKAIQSMYNTVGEYKVAYYAIDGDGNRIDKSRIIKVASQTKFVQKIGETPNQDIPVQTVNLRKGSGVETATGVIAYHIDSNGEIHQQPAMSGMDIEMTRVGMQEIPFTSTHHYGYIPGTNGKIRREADKTTKTYLIHGNVTINGVTDKKYFMDEEVNLLDGVNASFKQAKEDETIADTEVTVNTQYKDNMVLVDSPQKITVQYTATENITGVSEGNTAVATSKFTFIGLPQIYAPNEVDVKETATKNDIKKAINAKADINLVDSISTLTPRIQYDFSQLEKEQKVVLRVSYQLGEKIRTAEEEVHVNYKKAPEIKVDEQVELSVGDPFDAMKTPNVTLVKGDDTNINENNIKVVHEIPLTDNTLNTPGKYEVYYEVKDKYGNVAENKTTIYVDGLPVIEDKELHKRVGTNFDLNNALTANYSEASANGNLVETMTDVQAVQAINQKGQVVELSDVNKEVGKYTITFAAANDHGGKTVVERNLYVHGNVKFEDIDRKDAFVGATVNVLDGIKASFDKVEKDGTITKGKVKITSNAENNVVTSDEIKDIDVEYTAEDMESGVTENNTATARGVIRFVGKPQIETLNIMHITDKDTSEDIIAKVKEDTKATINLLDETKDITKDIQYKVNDNRTKLLLEVSYQLNDANAATTKAEVSLNYIPEINLKNSINLTVGDKFTDSIALEYVTAEDREDGNITKDIEVLQHNVDTTKPGKYTVTYKVTDSQGASTTKTVNVNVYPATEAINHIPVITASDLHLKAGDKFDDSVALKDVTAWDEEDKDISKKVVVAKHNVDTTKPGEYTVTYKVTDSHGASTTKTVNVNVYPATEAINHIPVITASDLHLKAGDKFDDSVALKDVTAWDEEDKDISKKVVVAKHNVDTTKPGKYTVTYKVSDSQGASTTKTVNVNVYPTTEAINHIPVIIASDRVLTVGDDFDPKIGITAIDKEDGDLTSAIEIIENTVDTSEAGVYSVTYRVEDKNGAAVIKTIKVTVKDQESMPTSEDSEKGENSQQNNDTENGVNTGNSTKSIMWSIMLCGSFLGLLFIKKRKNKIDL